MILAPVRFLANRHILLAIDDLREIRIRRQKGKFCPKWSFATTSVIWLFRRHKKTFNKHPWRRLLPVDFLRKLIRQQKKTNNSCYQNIRSGTQKN